MIWAVVMAGGVGTRFWPLSRRKRPKQLLPIVGSRTMIEETVRRLQPLIPSERILIITSVEHRALIKSVLPSIPSRNIIAEPCGRNTAPCIGLAAEFIAKKDPDAIFIALPADHIIRDSAAFQKHMLVACELAAQEKHVVFGIPPRVPHTGFGYLACKGKSEKRGGIDIYTGWKFTEKPPLWQARAFVRSGKYFWNSGMFVWKLSFFQEALREALPELAEGLSEIGRTLNTRDEKKALQRLFPALPDISIDYGLMEKAKNFCVVRSQFDWSDVGSWQELENWWPHDSDGNALFGQAVMIDSQGNIIRTNKRLVALLGVRDLIVVDTEDALLVARKDKAQDVKKIVDEIRKRKLTRYL